MRLSSSLLAGVALAVTGGCAGGPKPANSPLAATGPEAGDSDAQLRWTASFRPTTQRPGGLGAADQARAFGTITLSGPPESPNRTEVRLSVSTPNSVSGTSLPWAILPGRCGSGAVPLISIEQFGPIEIGNNSRGQLNTSLALPLPRTGSYHVNIYWPGGSQLSDVMTCGNLTRNR